MVIQCPECRTRFRFADERMKPEGVKVRCARCAQTFLATPPIQAPSVTPEREPDQVAAAPGFTEKAETHGAEARQEERAEAPASETSSGDDDPSAEPFMEQGSPWPPEPSAPEESSPPGFADDSPSFAPEEEVPFAEPEEEDEFLPLSLDDDPLELEGVTPDRDEAYPEEEPEETDDHRDAFAFDEKGDTAPQEDDFTFEQEPRGSLEGDGFAFDQPSGDGLDDFSFEESSRRDDDHFVFGTAAPQSARTLDYEEDAAGDFSFDADESAERDILGDTPADEETIPSQERDGGREGAGFDFGEIEFPHVAKAPPEESPLPFASVLPEPGGFPGNEPLGVPAASTPPPSPHPSPAKKKKGSMGRLLSLVLVFLLALVALAGYVAWQGGPEEMLRAFDRFGAPQSPPGAPAGQIRLGDLRGFFVENTETGQIFVISGQAVNEHQDARSAIAIKGVLYNAQGQPLLQQTVFAGNPLKEDDLRQLPFAQIEEQMNNQFGESLSNLNILPGKSIPFTIVFRDLPENLAEFTVEIADSRPGSGQ